MGEAGAEGAVEASEVAYRYGDRVALDGLSLRVAEGAIYGVLGPNGCGKSTLFRLLATISPMQQGRITLFGVDLAGDPSTIRRHLGVVFQNPAIDPKLTVMENLLCHGALYGMSRGEARDRAERWLQRFGLGDRLHSRCQSLSGGMQRRVELAKGMMHQPRLLLMDEPTSGLDPAARLEFWETIERLRAQEAVTVLMTTHFLDEAERCDRLLLVDQGKEVAEGTPADLRSDLGDAVLRVRCHGVQQAEAFRGQLLERWQCKIEQSADQLLVERLDAQVDWRRWLDEFPQQVRELSWARPTLEDLFLRKTGRSLAGDPGSVPPDLSRKPGSSRRRQGGHKG